jgi:hypothetical protein
MMVKKAEREDVDELFKSLQTSKTDQEKRILTLEKEFDQTVGDNQREIEAIKASVLGSLSKKADFALLERLRESNNKKIDFDQFQS